MAFVSIFDVRAIRQGDGGQAVLRVVAVLGCPRCAGDLDQA